MSSTLRVTALALVSFGLLALIACGSEEESAPAPAQPPAPSAPGIAPAPYAPAEQAAPAPARAPASTPVSAPVSRAIPSLDAAGAYELVLREDGADDLARVWIYADAEQVVSKVARAQTALRAAMDVIEQGNASRAEVMLLPVANKEMKDQPISLAQAQFDPISGQWEASAVGGEIDEFVLLALDLLGDNANLFIDEGGAVREEAFSTYLARVLATSPREAQSYLREAMRISSNKSSYNP